MPDSDFIALDIDEVPTTPGSSTPEDISSKHHSLPHTPSTESLPLYFMNEDKPRRRFVRADGSPAIEKESLLQVPGFEVDARDAQPRRLSPSPSFRRHRHSSTTWQASVRENLEYVIPAVYTLLSCWSRFHEIGKSKVVVWDEAHFGKFGSHYLKREFYFDVHPPLGKMLVALTGWIAGYQGAFEFKSGMEYPYDVPFIEMRIMLAVFGVLMVPLAWLTAREVGMSMRASHIVAIMTLCDVAWLCISRFILLDAMLLCFTFTTIFCLTKFHSQRHAPFSQDWWIWLTLSGVSIGCVTSVKWIGLFATAVVGLYTIEDLWEKFGDLRMPVHTYALHWVSRAACLILLPILLYMASFKVHFIILNHSGPGDAQMPSLFQAHLIGNSFGDNSLQVAYGSKITLKNMGMGGGLLHSHKDVFPGGSKQQQVTCYHHKDVNNNWVIQTPWGEPPIDPNGPLRFLKDGEVIRLQHQPTQRNLHSHSLPAPITKTENEVSCYGNRTVGDNNDLWIVEVVDDLNQGPRSKVAEIHWLTTRMRFKHKRLGCYLRAANRNLPQWAHKQIEVTCTETTNPKDIHTYWNIENHWNDRLPKAEMKDYRSPFLRDFWHLNVAMMTSNNALIPDEDKFDILASKPLDWPLLRLGLRMCGWRDNDVKYYLVGNPVVWWTGTASLVVGVVALLVYLLRRQRKYADFSPGDWDKFLYQNKLALVGWFLHFAPFMVMGRVTYLHHYLPALYFSVLMFGVLLDQFVFRARRVHERVKWAVFAVVLYAVVDTFWRFKRVAFGMEGPIADHPGLLWRKTWNVYQERP